MIAAEKPLSEPASKASHWAHDIYRALKAAGVDQAAYVPDAGHAQLIELLHADRDVQTSVLTTEEEGIAIGAGAWLGGGRAVLLMQSSGVGNCINMLSLIASCRFPFLSIVTMRGEWAEFNPWQVPMGSATAKALEIMGVQTVRVDAEEDVGEAVHAAADMAFQSDQPVAILISQKMLGRKRWVVK